MQAHVHISRMMFQFPVLAGVPKLDETPGLPLVPSLIIMAVVVGFVAIVWWSNQNAKKAKKRQQHSSAYRGKSIDRAEHIQKGGLGGGEIGGA